MATELYRLIQRLRHIKLDPMHTCRILPPVIHQTSKLEQHANFEPIGHNLFVCNSDLQVAHFRFNFTKALQQGLIYDSDYRIALYVDDFPVIDYDTLIAAGPDSRYEPLFQSFAGLATGGEDKVSKFDTGVVDFQRINPFTFPYKRWTDTWDTAMKALDSDYGGKKERRTFGETCRYDNDCSWCLIGMPVPKINANKFPNECRFDLS